MNKITRFIGILCLMFFLIEVVQPSSAFVRAGVFSEGSSMVASFHHHDRHEPAHSGNENPEHRKTTIVHSATLPIVLLSLACETSASCPLIPQPHLESLPPTSQSRPPASA